ncbi:MAG: Lrp/AsnC family transcriptional regulator [Desulfovibrio sp.]|jgi:Lrp/AsnC family transcriptional regulator for asnA, asnC and gidA
MEKPLNLDHIDRAIVDELQRDGRASYKSIARKLGVSDGTVRLRTERMMECGYLRISASVNPLYFENTLTAIIGINLEKKVDQTIMEWVSRCSGVQSVINVTGRYDLLVELSVSSRSNLKRFLVDDLQALGGVVSTETYLYLEAINKWVEHKEHDQDLPGAWK